MTPLPAERWSGLRVAWLGHAVGHRADGLTTYSEQVVSGLCERGVEVYFHFASRDGLVVPVDQAHAVSWPTLRFKTVTVGTPGFRPRMRRWLRRCRPALLHCSLSFTMADGWVAEAAQEVGLARVATFHLPFGVEGTGRARVMRELHRFWARRLTHYQRVIVFDQDHRRRLAEVGLDPGRITVIPNAVDTKRFCPGESRLRAERLGGAELVVGFLGRLDPEKGVRELLQGFSQAALGERARLLLGGQGSLDAQVRAAAAQDPRVVYLGPLRTIDQRVDFLRAVDLFCLPSSAEGLSLALLEAMACGCVSAVTREGGLAVVGSGGIPLDHHRLADSLAEVLQGLDPGSLQGQRLAAREEVVRHHGLEAMLDSLLVTYGQCLDESERLPEGSPR